MTALQSGISPNAMSVEVIHIQPENPPASHHSHLHDPADRMLFDGRSRMWCLYSSTMISGTYGKYQRAGNPGQRVMQCWQVRPHCSH
jgi:hypothetical protein